MKGITLLIYKDHPINNVGRPVKRLKVPYILESNLHSGFGDFLNGKKIVRGSNLHLSFKHLLPTG
jgi:hypothetical protein